ncbi:MAG: lysylphosphatidylglycerol synthase domain-containing protein [Myxococcota bacterium]
MRRKALTTLASWGLAISLLTFLIVRADSEALLAALRGADLTRYLLGTCAFIAIWLAIDAYILSWLFTRLAAPVRWREMLRLRGATYLLIAVSFHLANAALVALVRQRAARPLAQVAAAMLVLYVGDLTALAGLSFAASLGSRSPILDVLRPFLGSLALGLIGLFALGVALRERLQGRPFFGVLAALGPADIARLVVLRAGFYASFVLFVWITLPAFQIHISLPAIASRMPVVMAVGALPLTPGGLGTTQAAMLVLFGELADSAAVLAYGIVYGLSLVLLRLPIGALLAPAVLGSLRPEEPGRA